MHHMAANWSPLAQEQRHQLCYGVWGVIGSTGRWPQVVNIWEEDGFEGLARSFRTELGNATLQDPRSRSGGRPPKDHDAVQRLPDVSWPSTA
jgi:hypothetical protein